MALPVLLPLEQLVPHSLEGRAAQRRVSLVPSSRMLSMTHPPWVGGMLREDEVGMPPRVSARTAASPRPCFLCGQWTVEP